MLVSEHKEFKNQWLAFRYTYLPACKSFPWNWAPVNLLTLPGTHHLLTTAFQHTLPDVDTRETLSFWISIKTDSNSGKGSLRKQLTFGNANTGFPAKWGLRNECRNSILMTRHYPDLGSASDWLNQISHAASPIWNFCACFSDVIWRGNQW